MNMLAIDPNNPNRYYCRLLLSLGDPFYLALCNKLRPFIDPVECLIKTTATVNYVDVDIWFVSDKPPTLNNNFELVAWKEPTDFALKLHIRTP